MLWVWLAANHACDDRRECWLALRNELPDPFTSSGSTVGRQHVCSVCVCFCMPLAPCDNCVTHSHTNHAANNKWVRPHMRGTIEMCALCSTVLCCGLVISSLPPAAVHGVAMANVTVFYVCGALMKTEILSSTSQRCPSICTYEVESSVIVLGLVIGHK